MLKVTVKYRRCGTHGLASRIYRASRGLWRRPVGASPVECNFLAIRPARRPHLAATRYMRAVTILRLPGRLRPACGAERAGAVGGCAKNGAPRHYPAAGSAWYSLPDNPEP